MTKISVIVPVYNVEKYLENCLNSLLQQTFNDFEVFCVNDGSTDNSLSILEGFAKKDDRIVIITQENKGQSVARNKALSLISGQYVVFLDSDDALPDYALQTMFDIAQKSNADVVVSEDFIKSNKKTEVVDVNSSYKVHNNPLKDILNMHKAFSNVWNKMYKAEILKNKRFIEGIYFEDWPFITTLFAEINSFATTNVPCYIYTNDNVSVMRSEFSEHKILSYMKGINFVFDYFKNSKDIRIVRERIITALKMCVNKTYRDKENNKKLTLFLFAEIKKLVDNKVISFHQIPLKTLFRLWKMK
ncbi:MAG: glycosyltransferase [Alphaproteobacteria bacterium]